MNKKVKKGLVISLSVFAVIFAALLILPFAFQGKIMTLAKKQVNGMINARVDFDGLNMSFIRHFPNASVKFENLRIVGIGDFEKDTLLFSEDVDLVLNLKSLFSDTGYEIEKLQFNNSRVFAHVLPDGKTNWDIMKVDSSKIEQPDTAAMSFNLKLHDFVIDNANIIYLDELDSMKAEIKNLNHRTAGDLTADSSMLKTNTTIDTLNFWMSDMEYLSKANIEMNVDINANLNDMLFKLSENSSRINAIPFSLAGWVKGLDDGWDMDLTLNAEKVDFKAILSMIPAIYSTSFEGVKAGGDVSMSGFMKGKMVGEDYPAFDLKLTAANGWFQYPGLPKSLQNINVAARILNPGGLLDKTIIDISRFSFLMGNNPFTSQMRIAYPMSDPEIAMKAVGKIDLGMIKDIYPLDAGTKLNGLLDINLDLAGRMSYYETNQYEKFKFGGKLNITNMLAKMKSLPQDISISKANMIFSNRYVDLTALQMKIGRNDLSATGKLENIVPYALHNRTLKGQMNLQSNYFNVSDFMTEDGSKSASKHAAAEKTTSIASAAPTSVFEIPKNIDFTMQAGIKELVYEKMNFTNAKGVLKVADGVMKFQNMSVQAFGGNMLINGFYSTTDPKKPVVNMDLAINEVVFKEVFNQVETIQKFAPIFNKAIGKFSTKLSFNSLLKSDMMPDLASIVGNGNFTTQSVGLNDVPALTALASSLKIKELASTTIKDLKLLFEIKEGKVFTKPFNFNVGDVKMNLGGATGLDQTIAYAGQVKLPAKLNLGDFSTVNVKIGGTFSKPKVSVDMKSMLNDALSGAKSKVKEEVGKQVDAAKTKITDEANKRKENAIKDAQQQADRIRAEAQKAGDKLIGEAKLRGDQVVAKASNPFAKKIAETAAKKMVDEATKKAADLNAKADDEAKKLLQKASSL